MTKLPKEKWDDYLDWLFEFEYEKMGIPEPDGVIFLDMPTDISQKLLLKRYKGDENKKDVHEKDVNYLIACHDAAVYAAEKLGWCRIICGKDGEPLTVEEISKKVTSIELDKKEVNIISGEKEKIKVIITPSYAENKKVTWESSDENIAIVENDEIISIKPGSAPET